MLALASVLQWRWEIGSFCLSQGEHATSVAVFAFDSTFSVGFLVCGVRNLACAFAPNVVNVGVVDVIPVGVLWGSINRLGQHRDVFHSMVISET